MSRHAPTLGWFHGPAAWRGTAAGLALLLGCAGGGVLLSGCAHPKGGRPAKTAHNVYSQRSALPRGLKRLAVLPLAAPASEATSAYALQTFEPLLAAELGKTMKFEVMPVDPRALRLRTGATTWRAQDPLPPALFQVVTNDMACDGVLLPEITCFQAYPTLMIGWRLRMLDPATGQTIWAADEVFTQADKSQWMQSTQGEEFAWHTQVSPRQFARASVEALLATLPAR